MSERAETYEEANARLAATIKSSGPVGFPVDESERDDGRNKHLAPLNFRSEPADALQFSHDPETNTVIVRVVNSDSASVDAAQSPTSASSFLPFEGIDASASGVAKIKFAYGTVGNASPTFGGNPCLPVSDEATVSDGDVVYLDATLDAAGNIATLIATRASSVPADGSTAGHYYRLLFEVTVSGGAVTAIGQSVTTNLSLHVCNGVAIWDRA